MEDILCSRSSTSCTHLTLTSRRRGESRRPKSSASGRETRGLSIQRTTVFVHTDHSSTMHDAAHVVDLCRPSPARAVPFLPTWAVSWILSPSRCSVAPHEARSWLDLDGRVFPDAGSRDLDGRFVTPGSTAPAYARSQALAEHVSIRRGSSAAVVSVKTKRKAGRREIVAWLKHQESVASRRVLESVHVWASVLYAVV